MNFEISSSNPLELEQIITTLFAQSKCACHILNPHKTRILMWKVEKPEGNSYHLRVGIQRFISQEQKDRSGKIYWRFYLAEPEESKEPTNQTQTQAVNHTESDKTIEQPTNQSQVESEQTPAVQKFREKYGTPTNPK